MPWPFGTPAPTAPKKPLTVALEGMDASGKATQAMLLAKWLGAEVMSFPWYDTHCGKAVLGHLKSEWQTEDLTIEIGHSTRAPVDPLVFQCIQTCNRLELLPRIKIFQDAGVPIVFDRYWASSVVYGMADGLDKDWLMGLQKTLCPVDVQIYIDITEEESIKRRPDRRDRYEKRPGFMAKVRKTYIDFFTEMQKIDGRWHLIDGLGTEEEVLKRILDCLPNPFKRL